MERLESGGGSVEDDGLPQSLSSGYGMDISILPPVVNVPHAQDASIGRALDHGCPSDQSFHAALLSQKFQNSGAFLEVCCGSALATAEVLKNDICAVGIDRVRSNFKPVASHIFFMDLRSADCRSDLLMFIHTRSCMFLWVSIFFYFSFTPFSIK